MSGIPVPPLNVNQTPISGVTQNGDIGTGDFFSREPSKTSFQGPQDLLGGVSASIGGGVSLTLAAGAVLVLALLLRKK